MTVTATFSKQKPPITELTGKKTQLLRHDTKPCANLRHKKLKLRPILAPVNLGPRCRNFALDLLPQPRLTYLNPIRPVEPADRQALHSRAQLIKETIRTSLDGHLASKILFRLAKN